MSRLNMLILQAKHPSAFDKFEEIIEAAIGKCIAVFLDYDGTLSPIVDDPECAFMSDEVYRSSIEILYYQILCQWFFQSCIFFFSCYSDAENSKRLIRFIPNRDNHR